MPNIKPPLQISISDPTRAGIRAQSNTFWTPSRLPIFKWGAKAVLPGELRMLKVIAQIEGWLSDEVALLLYRLCQNSIELGPVVEIGSWHGKSTITLALALKESFHNTPLQTKIISIDPHTGSREHHHLSPFSLCDSLPAFTRNISTHGLDSWIHSLVMTSQEAFTKVDGPLSGVFIDGSHERADVEFDFRSWFTKLSPGGWMAFHDSKWPGVRDVLWQEFYTQQFVGPILRIEDTTFAFKRDSQSWAAHFWNRNCLRYYQSRHYLKRRRRKLRKQIKNRLASYKKIKVNN